jgi:phosphoglycerate dehydrogenase-like enzyme
VPILAVNAATAQRFWRLPEALRAALAARLPSGWSLEVCEDAAALGATVRRSRAVLGWPFPAALARRAADLRWVHFFTSGIPEGWTGLAVEVTSSTGVLARSVAEHGLFLALAGVRGARADSFATWDAERMTIARDPAAMQALVVGQGAVGRELCRLLAPLFASVRALARAGAAAAGEAFAAADLVVLALPLSDESRALVASAFAALRPDVILVNLARGELVDEAALLAFLDAHPQARYLADVAHPEPYPDHLPLRRSPQVLLTPHVAARRADAWERTGAHALALLDARLGSLG